MLCKLKPLLVIPKISVKCIHAHILMENIHYINPVNTTMNIRTLQSYIFSSYLTNRTMSPPVIKNYECC